MLSPLWFSFAYPLVDSGVAPTVHVGDHVDLEVWVGNVVIRLVALHVNTDVVDDLDIEVAVEVVSDVDSCAGWAGATPRRSREGLGGPAPKNRGSLPPNLRPPRGPQGARGGP